MGYPLSSLQQLSRLCEKEQRERRFDRYKLVSVLVAGPNDRAVKNAMLRNFERLDVSTGMYFAFITFIEPPTQWKQTHGYRMDYLEALSEGFFTDEGRMISALRERFCLPDSACLMLTDHLSSNRYAVIPVDENDLVEKMESIGTYAEQRHDWFPITDPGLQALLSRYGPVYIEQTEDKNSIERNITDIKAVDSLHYRTGDYVRNDVRREAEHWVRNTLQELLYKVKSAIEENYVARLKRYSEYLALTLQTVEPIIKREKPQLSISPDMPYVTRYVTPSSFSQEEPRRVSFYERYLIPDRYVPDLTPYSRKKVSSYNQTARFLIQGAMGEDGGYPGFIPAPEDDFAPLGFFMGHIIEEELNASIVQLSRKFAGIQMPTYYRIWDDTQDNDIPVLENKKGCIYLNRKSYRLSNGKFSVNTITIGQAPLVIRQMQIIHPEGQFGYFGEEDFLSRIAGYAHHRNNADHIGEYSYKDFMDAHEDFSTICENDLRHISKLKKQLQSQSF